MKDTRREGRPKLDMGLQKLLSASINGISQEIDFSQSWIHNLADLSKHERTYEIRSNTTNSCNVMYCIFIETPLVEGRDGNFAWCNCCKPTLPYTPSPLSDIIPFDLNPLLGQWERDQTVARISLNMDIFYEIRKIEWRWCWMTFPTLNPTSWWLPLPSIAILAAMLGPASDDREIWSPWSMFPGCSRDICMPWQQSSLEGRQLGGTWNQHWRDISKWCDWREWLAILWLCGFHFQDYIFLHV